MSIKSAGAMIGKVTLLEKRTFTACWCYWGGHLACRCIDFLHRSLRLREAFVNPRIKRILLAAGALAVASVIGFASHSRAQGSSAVGAIELAQTSQTEQKRRTVAPRQATPRRQATPKRVVTPRRVVTPKRTVTPRVATPKEGSPTTRRSSGPGFRAIATGGRGRALVRGRNYTVWRGLHRVRYSNRWRTLGALSALSVLFIGGTSYYPYAYLSAPEPVCEGETEDGCILQWQEVETIEGPRVYQCVAYCPWQ